MQETIAKQLKIKDFPFVIKDKGGKEIYWEDSNNYWCKREYDANGNAIYWENSNDFWGKIEYDAHGNAIYYENSYGVIIDNRPKVVELTMEEIADKMGINVTQLRIKD
jgi:hypothetical protein